jgi:thiamine biosynthesis lipoprotein
VHRWTYEVLQEAVHLNRRSAGVFDVAIAPALQRLGLLPAVGNDSRRLSGLAAVKHPVELLPSRYVRLSHRCTGIDLGGIAKGFAVDRAVEALRRHGMPMGMVNAGGDMSGFGERPWRVDIRDPRHPGRLLCTVPLRNAAMASSARRFDPFRSTRLIGAAVIDPRTGRPGRRICAATVRASRCVLADALTKVVMIAGPAAIDLLCECGADALVLSARGRIRMTRDFESALCLAA